jgi:hypothetical protein
MFDNEFTDLQESIGDGLFEEEFDFEEENGYYNMENQETEFDYEEDADPFLGGVVSGIARAASGPMGGMLKNMAQRAAVEAGRAIGGQGGARMAQSIAQRCLREAEMDGGEYEAMDDFEGELASIGGDPTVLQEMTHLAGMAAKAKTPQQADKFIGAIASLAGNLLPSLTGETDDYFEGEEDQFLPALLPLAKMALPHVMPLVSKGLGAIGRSLISRRRTREAAAVLPPIAAKAVTSLAKQEMAGKKLDRKRVAATVANAAAKTLASKPAVKQAVKASKALTQASREDEWSGQLSFGNRGYGGSQQQYNRGTNQRRRIIRPRYCVY